MSRFLKVMVVLAAASTLLVGPSASAITNVTTSLSLSVSRHHIHRGHAVTFTIHLKSPAPKCKANQPIKWYRNGVYRSTFTTDSQGYVIFTRHPRKTARYYAKFPGSKVGTHPHRKNCLPSTSNRVRVRVSP